MSVIISAVVPTYNRVEHLINAIDSLIDQSLGKNLYEILVIDNASNDNTRERVSKKYSSVTNLHYVYEPTMGLNVARNAGLNNAHGKYIAYLDDDAIASRQWLEKMVETFENIKPMPGIVGGKIEPMWEIEKPVWLSKQFEPYLTVLDLSSQPRFLREEEHLAGANMAFPKSVLLSLNGFQQGLDRIGTKLISNGEIHLFNQIKKTGFSAYYHPEISVKHLVPKSRVKVSWFKSRFFWQGYSDSIMWLHDNNVSSVTRLKLLLRHSFRMIFNYSNWVSFINNDLSRINLKLNTYYKLGRIRGLLRQVS